MSEHESASQKKRNRKKKKQPVNAAPENTVAAAAAPVPVAPSDAPLTDAELLRRAGMEATGFSPSDPMYSSFLQVSRRGYDPVAVRDVMDEMWSLNLPYDDPEAVIESLKAKSAGDAAASIPRPATNGHRGAEVASAPAATAAQPSAAAPAPAPAPTISTSAKSTPQPSPPVTPAPAKQQLTLEERLEAAAGAPNVADALAAITTWASMVEPSTMSILLQSRALELLLSNFLALPPDEAEAKVPSLRALLERVIPNATGSGGNGRGGSGSAHPAASAIAVSAGRLSARLESLGYSGVGEGGAVSAAAGRLAAVIREHYKAAEGAASAPALLRDAQAVAARSAASLPGHGGRSSASSGRAGAASGAEAVKELFITRERRHEAAAALERACTLALWVPPSEGGALGGGGGGGSASADGDLLDALLADAPPGSAAAAAAAALGETVLTAEGMRQGRGELDAARDRLRQLLEDAERVAAPLESEAELLAAQASSYAERRQALLDEVARIEVAEQNARDRSAALKAAAAEARDAVTFNSEASERQHAGLVEALRHVAACESVVDMLGSLEASLGELLQSCTASAVALDGESAASVQQGIGAYLGALESYLASEGECMALLRERSALAEQKVAQINREMSQYAALRMSTMVADLSATAAKLQADADEDKETISQLLEQAAAAANALGAMLRNDNGSGVSVWCEHAQSLAGVLRNLHSLGLADGWDLSHLGVTQAMVGAPLPPPPALQLLQHQVPQQPQEHQQLLQPQQQQQVGGEPLAQQQQQSPTPPPQQQRQAQQQQQLAGKQGNAASPPRPGPPGFRNQAANAANLPKVRGGVVVPRFEAAEAMPVLTWARAAPAPSKSLAEIQKEESAAATFTSNDAEGYSEFKGENGGGNMLG